MRRGGRAIGALLLAGALLAGGPLYAEETRPLEPDRAETLVDAAAAHIAGGRMAEAEAALGEALPLFQARQDRRGEAFCRLLQGLADTAAGRDAAAVASFEQSLPVLEESGELMTAWLVYVALAEVEKRNGHTEKAIAHYERALAVVGNIEDPSTKLSVQGFARLGKAFGVPGIDLGQLELVVTIARSIWARFAEAAARDGYAGVLIEGYELERAEAELARSTELSRLFGGLLDGSIAARRGDLRRYQWRLDEARQEYETALAAAQQPLPLPFPRSEQEVVSLLGRLAEIELLSGRLEQALAWNDKALALVRGKDRKREASVLDDRAELFRRSGRLGEAEALFNETLAIATETNDLLGQVTALSDLGTVAMLRGAYKEAAVHLEKAASLGKSLDEPLIEAGVLITLSEVYLLLEAPGSARATIEGAQHQAKQSEFPLATALSEAVAALERFLSGKGSAVELLELYDSFWRLPEAGTLMIDPALRALFLAVVRLETTGDVADPGLVAALAASKGPQPFPYASIMALFLRGRLHALAGEWQEARDLWARALDEARRVEQKDYAAMLSAGVALIYWKQGQPQPAIEQLSRAVALLEEQSKGLQVEELLSAYLGSQRRWFYELLVEMLVQQGRTAEAFDYAERARARALLQLLGNRRLKPAGGADAQLVAEAEALRMAIADWERQEVVAEGPQRLALENDLRNARDRYAHLLVRLKVSNPAYAAITSVEPLTAVEVQRALPPDTALISYFVTRSTTHAWVVDREAFHYVGLPIGAAELRQAGDDWAKELGGRSRGATPHGGAALSPQRAEHLYRALVAPLVPHLRHRRLLLIPHDALHYIPFAALREPASGRYLIQDYTLAYAPSTSVLPFLRGEQAPIAGRALVLGAPEALDPRWGRLPAAREEAKAVARLFGAVPLLDAEARESRLYDLRGEVDLLHIAAHGFYERASPLFSRLVLAPGDGHDGNLEVHEIFAGLDLAGVDLVVLSACRTGQGERSGGDEITGLTRALLYAGTPAVISTLWDIDDAASALLMQEFYRRLLEGVPAAEALQQAQLSLLHHPGYEAPFFWAAFSLTGDPRGQWQRAGSPR
ncbi:MAG TPA: CHAT domain-containing protein [Thermoanaerobaculia bacterium]|nr:CHAT domain-containing protein [Thermoanaerobaculia bacterium]